jgi:glutamate--cysteine ligase
VRSKRRLGLKNFDPCTILLNNDLSAGAPGILEDLHEQYLLPPLHAGWSVRRKSRHFQSYEDVAKRFGKMLGIDPWLVNPLFNRCGELNFAKEEGMDCLRTNVDALLAKVRKKYKEYGINEKPFVIVKADNGTQGMGIMTVRDVKDLEQIRQRPKNKPPLIKGGRAITDVIIQEGVLTAERINEAVAEPVVYLMDRYVVGGFYRIHAERGIDENLNAPGSSFVPLAFAESTRLPQPGQKPGASAPNRFYMYGVIGRLAMLAASYELEATDPEAETFD